MISPVSGLMNAAEALHRTAQSAEHALKRGDYLAYSKTVTEAVARFGDLHRAYRDFIDFRKRYQP